MYNSTFLLSAQLHTITAHQNINAAAIHIMSASSFFLCAVCCFAATSSCAAAPKATTAFRCPCNFTSMLHLSVVSILHCWSRPRDRDALSSVLSLAVAARSLSVKAFGSIKYFPHLNQILPTPQSNTSHTFLDCLKYLRTQHSGLSALFLIFCKLCSNFQCVCVHVYVRVRVCVRARACVCI